MHQSLILVVGLGKTGHSIARYLKRRNKAFVVFDTRLNPSGLDEFYAEFPGVDVFLETLPEKLYDQLAEIICSPGVSLDEPFMQTAAKRGLSIIGDIECLAREVQVPIVAITGTNGKSTVTTLVGEMVKATGVTVAVAGNIGLPVLDILDIDVAYALWVLELSSFQLDLTHSLSPAAATILNITPDHLDRHHTLEAYIQSKQRVYHQATILLYNREDKQTFPCDKSGSSRLISFGSDAPEEGHWGLITRDSKTYLSYGNTCFLAVDDLRIKGQHNWMNALAACALAESMGVPMQSMVQVLKRFGGLPHRSQWIRTLDGVEWINDSKGTNVGATLSAIAGIGEAIKGKIVLIAGGVGKGADFTVLQGPVGQYVRSVILIGEDAGKLETALSDVVSISHSPTLDAAVEQARKDAVQGDVVLLSPACASLDMFRDFNHRGEDFIMAVNAL